ncbi:mate-domain-containing protein [Umbelopsis sp. PMI_123]|nr:mate-domain-containing protein [Umbelopsis sp. PMI_123]
MEQTSLLSAQNTSTLDKRHPACIVVREALWLIGCSGPTVIAYFLQVSLQIAPIVCLGHLGTTELAAYAVGSMFAGVTGWSLAVGIVTAMDMNKEEFEEEDEDLTYLGIQLQRTFLSLAALFLPVSFVWWHASTLLSFLGQNDEITQLAVIYLRYLLIGAPAYFSFEALKKFCQTQGIVSIPTKVLMVVSPINAILNYVLIFHRNLGLIGASVAISITYWLLFLSMVIYVLLVQGKEAWGGWSRQAFSDYTAFLVHTLVGIFMVCSEWWAFEILTLAASYIGVVDLASQSIMMTIASTTFILPFGISVSGANRIEHWLECADTKYAKYASNTAISLSIFFGAGMAVFYKLAAPNLATLFTSQSDMTNVLVAVLPLVGLCQMFESISTIASGILRGMNRPQISTYMTLSTYYCLVFPLSFILAFGFDLGISGLWMGMIIGFGINASVLLLYIYTTVDWQHEVDLANGVGDIEPEEGLLSGKVPGQYQAIPSN